MIFGFLGKSKSKGSQTQTIDQTQTTESQVAKETTGQREQQQSQTGSSATQQETQQQSQQTVRTLDEGTQQFLQEFIQSLGGQAAGGAEASPEIAELFNISRGLQDRAAGADAAISGNLDAILNSARETGEQQLAQTGTGIARTAGSGLNSAVAELENRGRAELETSLAGIAGQLGLQGRQLATDEFTSAIAPFISALEAGQGSQALAASAIPAIAQVLKGAETTGQTLTTGSAQSATESQVLSTLLESLLEQTQIEQSGTSTTKGTTTGESSGSNTASPMSSIKSIFGLFA